MSENINKQVHEVMKDGEKPGFKMELPPPASKLMEIEFVEHIPGKSFKIKFPLKREYHNPGGIVLGGFFSVFFDMAYGPFSYLECKEFASSLDLNMSFLKPLKASDEFAFAEAELVSMTKSFLTMRGKIFKQDGTLVATGNTRMIIMKNRIPGS